MDIEKGEGNGPLSQAGYTSATVVSTAANYIMDKPEPFTHTFRTYIRLRESGKLNFKLWHSNAVDSTWNLGQEATGSELGGEWLIEAAYIADGGVEVNGAVQEQTQVAVLFDGSTMRKVRPGESFWSDEIAMELPEGHLMVFTWTLTTRSSGRTIPYNVEGILVSAYDAAGNLAAQESADSFALSDNLLVLPSFIGYKKQVNKKLVFLGDSITQGVRTLKDEYEYWVARIAAGLGADYGVWNIGSGWARAYDASADGVWLNKAKQGDEVVIVLGVNDIDIGNRSTEELLSDLTVIISKLREANDEVKIILGTVPPFNFQDEREHTWRSVNSEILSNNLAGVNRVFDIAGLLSLPAPHDHRIKPEYMSNKDDPHPNGKAGKAIADAFLNWY
ncbi:SGNH/GDSL hydrolase family protein [Paenibacillus monticola]|uniref:SGNH/GDSL hydrolase family protein n=1 Tax=Paenibacillus monticola TaxID=2666075 RepID=A0A7X2KZP7_9BACL|nr:SGNH/GDSL hydrolase family protein [Paenibacillus monticola]MRN51444.1 SGNH/GDSL hydrolase family protein [Paenibacillus monticola]